jgi:plastocyanin
VGRIVIIVVVIVVFAGVAGVLIVRQTGGGGQNRTFNVTVNGSTMSPSSMQAKQGDTLTFTVTTDKAEEIHLHGYDIMFAGQPGKAVSKTFKADRTCTCDIEIESSSTHLGDLTVRP